MRKRTEILDDPKRTDMLILEVLVDIRDLISKKLKQKRGKKGSQS